MLTLDGTRQADCVIMFEVAEHMDPMHNDKIVDGVFNTIESGGTLIFTAAKPGQGGVGHINCRPRKYWLDKFLAKGLVEDVELKDQLINYCRQGYHMGWFVNNVMILKKA
jgi:hypothetical protein